MARISILLTPGTAEQLALLEGKYKHAPKATLARIALTVGVQQMLADAAEAEKPKTSEVA